MADLRCEHLAASYGERAVLSEVDLLAPGGSVTAILGASGSGKTTLLRVIMGFVHAERGRLLVGEKVVAQAGGVHLAPEKRAIGYVAQEGALYPHLSVGENVGFGLARAERKAGRRVREVLDLVGLGAGYASRRAHELSGGEQRRVALARALAPRPPVVLLDEPFSGLDAGLRAETRAAVLHALGAHGTTAVLVTHDQAEALSMGREVGVLRNGRLAQTASPAELYRTPIDLDVARFVGDTVVLPGHAVAGVLTCALGDLVLLDPQLEGAVDAMIRPEQIQTHPAGAGGHRRRAEVLGLTYHGPDTLLRLALESPPGITVTSRTFARELPDPGAVVELEVSGPVVAYPATGGRGRSAPSPDAMASSR